MAGLPVRGLYCTSHTPCWLAVMLGQPGAPLGGSREVQLFRLVHGLAHGQQCTARLPSRAMSLTLLDWRRRVAAMYADVRATPRPIRTAALARFRTAKDRLFREHPGLTHPRDGPAERVRGTPLLGARPGSPLRGHAGAARADRRPSPPASAAKTFALRTIGRVRLPIGELEVYWIEVYGGGIFVPFRDATAGTETYGAGRYLLDTVKGADLGGDEHGLVLDFNYAYHPSCAYDPIWSCPLAPRANWLEVPVRAGERLLPESS